MLCYCEFFPFFWNLSFRLFEMDEYRPYYINIMHEYRSAKDMDWEIKCFTLFLPTNIHRSGKLFALPWHKFFIKWVRRKYKRAHVHVHANRVMNIPRYDNVWRASMPILDDSQEQINQSGKQRLNRHENICFSYNGLCIHSMQFGWNLSETQSLGCHKKPFYFRKMKFNNMISAVNLSKWWLSRHHEHDIQL